MMKPGRNDPCPCGSGKKYKQCCLRAEENRVAGNRSEAVPRAIQWLTAMHGPAVREALDRGFFGSLDDDEYDLLPDQHDAAHEGIMINAMEWLLADGSIIVRGQERRVAELLLGRPLAAEAQFGQAPLLDAAHAVAAPTGVCRSMPDYTLSCSRAEAGSEFYP